MKKRFLNLFLALALAVCALPMVASAATGCRHDKSALSTIKKVEAKAATCEEAGYDAYYTCDYCKCIFQKDSEGKWVSAKKVTIPATGHSSVNKEAIPATCVAEGRTAGKQCSTCKKILSGMTTVPVTNHTEVEIPAVAATCTTKAYTAGKMCSVCNKILVKPKTTGKVLGHSFTYLKETTKQPTCTVEGEAIYECVRCEETETRAVEKLPHTAKTVKAKAATCSATGYTAGTQCKDCKVTLSGMETIEKIPHTKGSMKAYIKRPTCQETGSAEYYCEKCDGTLILELNKLVCNIVEKEGAVAPTCNNTGLAGGTKCDSCDNGAKCAYCKATLKEHSIVPALGHDQVLVGERLPTCTKTGWKKYDCTRCGYDGVKVTVDKLGHDKDITVVKEATCTTNGRQYFECKREGCGIYELEEIVAPGHTEEIVPAVPATCTSTGLTEGKKCSVCDETLLAQTVTDKLAHDFSVPVERVEATCTADGYTAHMKCANCDATEGKEELDTDGHVYENYICKVCGARDGSCEHKNRVLKYTAPTCADYGSQSMWCPDCNYETMEMLDPIAHTPKDLSVAPTCSTAGKHHVICAVCNADLEGPTVLEATNDHKNDNGVCSACGATVCNHSDTTTTTTSSTCVEHGIKTVTCNSCGKVTKTELSLVDHKYVNNICSVCGKKDSSKVTYDYQDIQIVGGTGY